MIRVNNSTTNIYVEIKAFHEDELPKLLEMEYYASNVTNFKSTLFKEQWLKSYIDECSKFSRKYVKPDKWGKIKRNKAGLKISVMLPTSSTPKYMRQKKKYYKNFISEIIKEVTLETDPHYFVNIANLSGVRYLNIYCLDRYFYPEGRTIKVKREKTLYKDPVNGRMCKKDTLGAILVYSKGEEYEKTITLSDKLDWGLLTRRPTSFKKEQFRQILVNAKHIVAKFFRRTRATVIESPLIISKLSYKVTRKFKHEYYKGNFKQLTFSQYFVWRKRKKTAINNVITTINNLIAFNPEHFTTFELESIERFYNNFKAETIKKQVNDIEEICTEHIKLLEQQKCAWRPDLMDSFYLNMAVWCFGEKRARSEKNI
ncbi:MAG: hypothetical protein ACRCUP_01205 [Mycoplasmatales bacterium]